jgi:putative endonuclease
LRGGQSPTKQSPVKRDKPTLRRLLRLARNDKKHFYYMEREYCVYIMTNAYNTVLYTGVTNDLRRRVLEHKSGKGSVFVKRYNVNKLVYFEVTNRVEEAIYREKQIKGGSRQKKIDLINTMNPEWKDLFSEYFG